MLLTRSPLHVRPRAVSSFDLHVLGTPPAFILSQDQTLRLRGGNRFPLKSDLGFGPRPPPVLRVRARAGFPFARIVCLAFLFFAVQYPVFKVLRRPSRGPVAFGSTRSARRYITRPLPRRQELFSKFFEAVRRLLISLVLQERSVPRFPQTRVLYITRKVYVRQWIILQNLKLFLLGLAKPQVKI